MSQFNLMSQPAPFGVHPSFMEDLLKQMRDAWVSVERSLPPAPQGTHWYPMVTATESPNGSGWIIHIAAHLKQEYHSED